MAQLSLHGKNQETVMSHTLIKHKYSVMVDFVAAVPERDSMLHFSDIQQEGLEIIVLCNVQIPA